MSSKDAPPLTDEQRRFEAFYQKELVQLGQTWGFGRGKDGKYLAALVRICWNAWQAAQHGSA